MRLPPLRELLNGYEREIRWPLVYAETEVGTLSGVKGTVKA